MAGIFSWSGSHDPLKVFAPGGLIL
jgi:hypothetical protein